MVKITLHGTDNEAKIINRLSKKFEVNDEGVRQGDPLCTMLFNFALEQVMMTLY